MTGVTRTVTRTYVTTGIGQGRAVTAGVRLDGSTLILNGIKRPVRGWVQDIELAGKLLGQATRCAPVVLGSFDHPQCYAARMLRLRLRL
jgi:hypothetical protein